MALALISCAEIEADGPISTQNLSVSSTANAISVCNAMNLTLSDRLEPGELSITTNVNIHDYIIVDNDRDELSIELKRGRYKDLNIDIVASSKQYNDIEASGASRVVIDGEAASFYEYDIDLSGASSFDGELLIDDSLDVTLSGASEVNISGSARSCDANLTGASRLYNTSFVCDALDAELSGSSKVKLSVTKSITGELSGSSIIEYVGSPIVSVETTGGSTTRPIK